MPIKNLLLGLAAAFALAGCPTPPPSGGGDQPGQPGQPGPPPDGAGPPPNGGGEGAPPPNGGEGGPPPGEGAGPPGEGAPGEGLPPEGAEEGPKGNAPDPADLPSFADLIGDGPHINVTLNIEGASSGQVDFQVFIERDGAKQPKVLHIEKYTDNKLVVKAPADYEEPVYISVNGSGRPVLGEGEPDDFTIGGVPDAVTFGSTDLVFDVVVGDEPPPWMGFPDEASDNGPPLEGEGEEGGEPPPPQ